MSNAPMKLEQLEKRVQDLDEDIKTVKVYLRELEAHMKQLR